MKTFKVYEHPVFDSTAIKKGVSFPILIFTVVFFVHLWMGYKRLWTQFWIWTIYVILILHFYTNGQLLQWQLDGTNKLFWIGVSLLIYFLYPFVFGNYWLGKQLEKEGYKLIDTVIAKNKSRAIKIAENNYEIEEDSLNEPESNTILLIIVAILIAIIIITLLQ